MLSTLFSITPVFLLAATLLFTAVGAMPLPGVLEVAERDVEASPVSLLSPTDISGFTSFTQFARAAYCPQSKIKNWSCGGKLSLFPIGIGVNSVLVSAFAGACSAVPGFQPTLTGGDGASVPLCEYLGMVWWLMRGLDSLLHF